MKISEQADNMAKRLADIIKHDVTSITTKQQAAQYDRELPAGCYMLRVHIVANADITPELGTMTLYPTVSKKQLRREPDSVLASVLRFIAAAGEYRAAMLGKVRERAVTQ